MPSIPARAPGGAYRAVSLRAFDSKSRQDLGSMERPRAARRRVPLLLSAPWQDVEQIATLP